MKLEPTPKRLRYIQTKDSIKSKNVLLSKKNKTIGNKQ